MIVGVLLVTTPQVVAVEVAKRGAVMYNKLKVPVIGIVENMSSVKCPSCSINIQLFGNGAVKKFADSFQIKILARVPLEKEINESSDVGVPVAVQGLNSIVGGIYGKLARDIIDFCANKVNV